MFKHKVSDDEVNYIVAKELSFLESRLALRFEALEGENARLSESSKRLQAEKEELQGKLVQLESKVDMMELEATRNHSRRAQKMLTLKQVEEQTRQCNAVVASLRADVQWLVNREKRTQDPRLAACVEQTASLQQQIDLLLTQLRKEPNVGSRVIVEPLLQVKNCCLTGTHCLKASRKRHRAGDDVGALELCMLGMNVFCSKKCQEWFKEMAFWDSIQVTEKQLRAKDANGLFLLALCSYYGVSGFKEDTKAAYQLFCRAAALKHAYATECKAVALERGEGVTRNIQQTAKTMLVAADLGSPYSCERCGWYFKGNWGFPLNLRLAYVYLEKSMVLDPTAQRLLDMKELLGKRSIARQVVPFERWIPRYAVQLSVPTPIHNAMVEWMLVAHRYGAFPREIALMVARYIVTPLHWDPELYSWVPKYM